MGGGTGGDTLGGARAFEAQGAYVRRGLVTSGSLPHGGRHYLMRCPLRLPKMGPSVAVPLECDRGFVGGAGWVRKINEQDDEVQQNRESARAKSSSKRVSERTSENLCGPSL